MATTEINDSGVKVKSEIKLKCDSDLKFSP